MEEFEKLLEECHGALERDIRYRIWNRADADDILQETCITAFRKFDSLRDKTQFRAWILRIARNKVIDYFRSRERCPEMLMEPGKMHRIGTSNPYRIPQVSETMANLTKSDREILALYYYDEMTQQDIALLLGLPLGTVKSRLYYAKEHFRQLYPHRTITKGTSIMKKLPEIMPNYTITPNDKVPFSVKHEEMPGCFIIPKLGEKVTYGTYDSTKKLCAATEIQVTDAVILHGIPGVELRSQQDTEGEEVKIYYASLTDTHIRWLGESYRDSHGIRRIITFLDGGDFMTEWAFDENNTGVETNLTAKGLITRDGNTITTHGDFYRAQIDIVGAYTVQIGGKSYDTVCLMYIYKDGAATEQFLDPDGHTILWRRYNKDDWWYEHQDNKLWSERFPDNDRLTINGETYVHWYDCITDSIC